MWITLMPAIIGLVGVLVGGIISTGANYLLAVRKERAEEARKKLSRANEQKTSARLIESDLSLAFAFASAYVERKPGGSMHIAAEIKFDAWQKDRGVLARELPVGSWNAVKLAAIAAEQFRALAIRTTGAGYDGEPHASAELDKTMVRIIQSGLEALRPYT